MVYNTQPDYFDSKKLKTKYFDIFAIFAIFCNAFVKMPNTIINIVLSLFVVFLLCTKNYRAVLIGFCIGGLPFMSLFKKFIDFSITQAIIGVIIIQIIVLLINKNQFILTNLKKGYFPRYLFIMLSMFFLFLASFSVSPKSPYSLYYIQFFLVYAVFYSLGGILVVQKSISLKSILLPSILFTTCLYPLFNFTLLHVPTRIFNSPVGLRGYDAMDAISVGRLAGGLIILVLYVLWEVINDKKLNLILFIQVLLAIVISGPLLWYSQTRQAMLSTILSIVISSIIILLSKRKSSLWLRCIVFITPVVLIWSSFLFLNWAESHLAQVRVKEFKDVSRQQLWSQAWKDISKEPIIGYGLGDYHSKFGTWPHNWLLELWHDYGIIGVLLFLILVFTLLSRVYFDKNSKSLWLFVGIYWVIVAQASADIPRNAILFFFFTIALLPLSDKTNSKKKFNVNEISFHDAGNNKFSENFSWSRQ